MGRFGIRSYAGNWSDPIAGVRPLVKSDALRVVLVLSAILASASIPAGVPAWWHGVALAIPVTILLVARVPWSHTASRLAPVVPFGVMAIVFLPWTAPGETRDLLGVTISETGLKLACVVFLKLLSASSWLSWLSAATPVPRLLEAVRRLRVPAILVDILESTIRYLGILASEAKQMMLSCRLRGAASNRVNWTWLKARFSRMSSLVAGLFLRTLDRSDRCVRARVSREIPAESATEYPRDRENDVLIEGISYCYPGAEGNALTGITMNVPAGKRIAILGANGAGKTTLLLHLNGVLLPQSGRVTIAGTELRRETLREVRARVGMVFQNPDDQVFAATIFRDVCFGPEQAGLEKEECERIAEESLRLVGLWGHKDRAPFSLSQGQRKRAAIAGVLATGSGILLFDEPMASLDPAGKDEIQVLLDDLHSRGKTIVVATHDVDFAAAWADGVVLMECGRIVALGAPDLLVDETALGVAGLALPLVARPFDRLRPLVKHGDIGLRRLPANVSEAFSWLKYHFVDGGKRPTAEKALEKPTPPRW